MGWFNRFIGNPSPPKGANTGCLCWDKQTYAKECCDGSFKAQGIGVIYRQPASEVQLIEDTLSNDEYYSNPAFEGATLGQIFLYNSGQHLLTAFNETTISGTRLIFPYALTGKIYGFVLPNSDTMETPITLIEVTLAGETSITHPAFEGKELKAIHIQQSGQHLTTAFDSLTLVGSTLQFPYAITGKVRGVVFG
jgi:hypothetical protein